MSMICWFEGFDHHICGHEHVLIDWRFEQKNDQSSRFGIAFRLYWNLIWECSMDITGDYFFSWGPRLNVLDLWVVVTNIHSPAMPWNWDVYDQVGGKFMAFCVRREWIPSLKLTYPLKIDPWKRRFLLKTIIFRAMLNLGSVIPTCHFHDYLKLFLYGIPFRLDNPSNEGCFFCARGGGSPAAPSKHYL